MKVIIHGENVFIPVKSIPKGEVRKVKKVIAGHSETGHHHTVISKTPFEVLEKDEAMYFKLFAPAKVEHQKSFEIHETKTLDVGIYKRIFATEYNPFTKVIQRIFD